jgi:hypothetical protein
MKALSSWTLLSVMALSLAACLFFESHEAEGECCDETPIHCVYCCGSHLSIPENKTAATTSITPALALPRSADDLLPATALIASIFNPPRA